MNCEQTKWEGIYYEKMVTVIVGFTATAQYLLNGV